MSSGSFCIEVARHMAAWSKAHATRDITQIAEMRGRSAWRRGMPGHFCHGGGAPVAAPQRHVSRGCQDKFVRPAGAVCQVCRVVRAPRPPNHPCLCASSNWRDLATLVVGRQTKLVIIYMNNLARLRMRRRRLRGCHAMAVTLSSEDLGQTLHLLAITQIAARGAKQNTSSETEFIVILIEPPTLSRGFRVSRSGTSPPMATQS